MPDAKTCPDCGSPLPARSPEGLCPRCLLGRCLAGETPAPAGMTSALDGPGDVLATLAATVGVVPRVLLRDTDGGPEPPLIRPGIAAGDGGSLRYRIDGEIARGGMGAVFKGRDPDLGRDVAVKVLREDFRHDADLVRRFVEEAQIGGQLQHPGVVPIYELGTLADRRPFFAMKLVKGQTLAVQLDARKGPAADLPRFLGVIEAIAQTVAYAHARGVIHRDLKPSNVMVGSFGEVQVMDWGLAKVLHRGGAVDDEPAGQIHRDETVIATARSGSDDADLSHAGSVLGTPSYMAPEQARGEVDRVDERADVFALGSILCEVLTGHPAFTGRSSGEIQRKAALGDTADALARLDACGADAELVAIARDCLAREPEDRPREAGAVSSRLTAYEAGVQDRLRRAEVARAAESARAEEARLTAAAAEAQARAERRARRMTVGLAASVLALVGLGVGGSAWISRQRSARMTAEAGAVNEALDEAAALRGQARSDPKGDPSAWAGALASAKRAQALLRPGESDPALVDRVSTLLAALGREQAVAARLAEQAEADRRLVTALEAVRIGRADHLDNKRTDAEYAAAFRARGLDVDRDGPAAFVAALAGRAASAEIAADLDDWAFVRVILYREIDMKVTKKKAAGGDAIEKVVSLAQAVDPDPRRALLWARFKANDRAALEGLAAEVIAKPDQPTATLVLLARALDGLQATDRAAEVFRAAWRRNPGDFWVNFELGNRGSRDLVIDPLEPRRNEQMRFMTAAVALRPASPAAHDRLGAHLWYEFRKPVQAMDEYREAIRIKPDFDSAWFHLALCLDDLGRRREAIDAFREAVRLDPDDGMFRFWLGRFLTLVGEFPEAVVHLRRAKELGYRDQFDVLGRAEQYMVLEKRLPAVLRGEEKLADPAERVKFAGVCFALGRYAAGARLCTEAYEQDPKLADDVERGRRYHEAISNAARGGAGQGRDDPSTTEADCARLRKQALVWLRQELATQERALTAADPARRKTARERLVDISVGNKALIPYREPASLAKLPETEQAEWRAFFADVASLIQKVKDGGFPK